jgi:hypothetical protein
LHRRKHARLIRVEGIAQLGRPVNLSAHQIDNIRKMKQRLHRRAEACLLGSSIQRRPFQRLVLKQPVAPVKNLLLIHRCGQHLHQQRIRIKSDWSQQMIECRRRSIHRSRRCCSRRGSLSHVRLLHNQETKGNYQCDKTPAQ